MNRSPIVLILAVALLTLLSACVPVLFTGGVATSALVATDRRSAGTVVDDEGIEMKAQRALESDTDLRHSAHVNVTSFNFVVLVSGEAPSDALRRRAEELVAALPTVRLVYNEMTLGEPSSLGSRAGDSVITTKVKGRMVFDKAVDSNHIKVVTERGVVFLMGLVTHQESGAVVQLARQTSGVQKVVSLFEYLD